MTGLPPPNHTQVPNILLDVMMLDMSESELKVTLAIVRKTLGWHKRKDQISYSQLEKLTGMGRQAVSIGIESALKRGLIEIVGTGIRGVNIFGLVISDQYENQTSDQYENQTTTGMKIKHTKETTSKEIKNTSQKSDGLPALKIPKEQLDTEFDTLALIWNGTATGFIVNIQGMLFGTRKVKGEWNKCKLTPPASCTEVIGFADYAQRRKTRQQLEAIPTAPDTIQRWFCDYRQERAKAVQAKPSDGYNSVQMNAAMFSEGKQS